MIGDYMWFLYHKTRFKGGRATAGLAGSQPSETKYEFVKKLKKN